MVSKLVLVRHAKTQTRSLELADRDRQLTRAGRRSVEARFPVTLRLVEDVSAADLKVWSSPALRALQTAEVVAHVLGIDGIEVKESLYTRCRALRGRTRRGVGMRHRCGAQSVHGGAMRTA